ncbi:cation:proton antiporter [Gloeocapsa sp. PCC 73106]|uniref:cation:proton antiporter domain-containing protein n=1 Tax=Gloeocapsa sp. PCC 73106 TaxID=102232 RepID=UPI0002ABC673|nr:cation:proton antiporter [Gloeocapsa sp. PCC 73106]ELS00002.1 Kef-type K+ transport system, predicted NAD-binding component [Gloeocapsa sp. PCC 73106]
MFDLISLFVAAAVGGILAALLRQPLILGYLIAGIIVGPFGLGFIKEYGQVDTVAELGVTFLLFALGVKLSLGKLQKVKNVSLGGGGLQILLTIIVTMVTAVTLGWVDSVPQGIFLGELIALSSTAVVLKALMERNEMGTMHGQVMVGILIVQDLALGLMLATLPALDKPADEIGVAIGIALLKLALFVLAAVVIGKWLIPPFLRLLAGTESKELFLLGVVALCLVIALITGELGLSTEMGAFVAGLMISEVEYSDQTLSYVEPLRDICTAAFFVSIGVLINPIFLWNNIPIILGLVALVIVVKSLIVIPLVRLFRYPIKTAIIAGLGLAQIGEFSFVLAGEGREFGLISQNIYLLILGTTAVTLAVTPFILELVPQFLAGAESIPWLESLLSQTDASVEVSEDAPFADHIIVCGYGRVGSNIVKLFRDRNYPVLVIDESEGRVQTLREENIPYIYGNASSIYVLEKAGIAQAKGMAIALPDPMSTRLCLKRSLQLNPELDLVVRANEEKDIELLYQLGAKEVVQPEFEASIELSSHLFTGLGIPLLSVQENMQQIRNSHYSTLRPEMSEDEVSREIKEATSKMKSKWYALPANSPLPGKTLEKAYIRRLTGVVLMAINRANGEKLDYPEPETVINEGDKFLVVGEAQELAAFERLARREVKQLPGEDDSCIWIFVPENSGIAGKTLAELNFSEQFGVSIQAIRRKGKYVRFPESYHQIQVGDSLLVFGKLESLTQVSQSITTGTVSVTE